MPDFLQKSNPAKVFLSWLPIRFFTFATVGLVGTGVHLLFLTLFHQWLLISFILSQAAATFIAMTNNYFLNNVITFKKQRHSGMQQFAGLFSFYLACSVGAMINLFCASFLYQYQLNWAIAGVLAGFSGSLWNFFASIKFTWKNELK